MNLGALLIIVLVVILLVSYPTWPHSVNWGYTPFGLVGTILVIVLVLVLLGRI
jgi:hypothetical protein